MSARARPTAGSRERGATKSGTGSPWRDPLAGVSMFVCSEKDGTAFLRGGNTAPWSSRLKRHVRLAPLCTGLGWLVIASTIASYCWLVASRFFCHARDVLLRSNVFCDHPELHRLSTTPPRWWIWPSSSTLRSMASMSRRDALVSHCNWRATQHDGRGHVPWEQETCRLRTAPLETGILFLSRAPPRPSTNSERGERDLHDKQFPCRKRQG